MQSRCILCNMQKIRSCCWGGDNLCQSTFAPSLLPSRAQQQNSAEFGFYNCCHNERVAHANYVNYVTIIINIFLIMIMYDISERASAICSIYIFKTSGLPRTVFQSRFYYFYDWQIMQFSHLCLIPSSLFLCLCLGILVCLGEAKKFRDRKKRKEMRNKS